MGMGCQHHSSAALPSGNLQCSLYRRLGGGSGWVKKISSPTCFDPRTVQHVASRYADYDNPAHRIPVDYYYYYYYYYYYCYYLSHLFKIHGMSMQGIWCKSVTQGVQSINGKVIFGNFCYRWSLSKISTLVPLLLHGSFKFLSLKIWNKSRMGLHPLLINWLHTWRRLFENLKVTQMLKNSYYCFTRRLPLLHILIQIKELSSDPLSALPYVPDLQSYIFLSSFRNKIGNKRTILCRKCGRFCTYCPVC